MKDHQPTVKPTSEQRETARRKAEDHFSTHDARTEHAKQEIARENAASDAKTARLRALRLAKEEADRTAAQNVESPATVEAKRPKRTTRSTRRRVFRVT